MLDDVSSILNEVSCDNSISVPPISMIYSGAQYICEYSPKIPGSSSQHNWESTSTHALINAVANELGLSALPYMLVKKSINKGNIAVVKIDSLRFDRKFNIIHHKNKFLTA